MRKTHISYCKELQRWRRYTDNIEDEDFFVEMENATNDLLETLIQLKEPYVARRNKILSSVFFRLFKKRRLELKEIDHQLDLIDTCIYSLKSYNIPKDEELKKALREAKTTADFIKKDSAII